MKKRIISMLLVVVLTVSLLAIPASAASRSGNVSTAAQPISGEVPEAVKGSDYTTVFISGFVGWGSGDFLNKVIPYWGLTTGNMMTYLRNQGYDVVDASLGPISSSWDRCCELFAQLTGTKTDYGAAHCAKCEASCADLDGFKHERFGRDYTGKAIVDNWGPIYQDGKVVGWNDNKLNLVGHSFGGPNAVMLLNLLAEGNQDEINWGKEQAALYGGDWHDYVSPLFWGDYDGQYLINSVTGLSGAFNGTSFLSLFDGTADLMSKLVVDVANVLGMSKIRGIYDFKLEQFGLTLAPEVLDADYILNELNRVGFLKSNDNAFYELSVEGCNAIKQGWKTYDNVYYFSFAGNKTVCDCNGNFKPDTNMTSVLSIWAYPMATTTCDDTVLDINGNVVGTVDETWFANDGMVNTVSSRYPIGAANKPYDANNIEAGMWQWKEVPFDHFQFNGSVLNSKPSETRTFALQIMHNIDACDGINPTVADNPDTDTEQTVAPSTKAAEPVQKNVGGDSLLSGIGNAIGAAANALFNFMSKSLNNVLHLFVFK